MAGRKRHSAEEIVRNLRRADELAAAGKVGEDISVATLRRAAIRAVPNPRPTSVPVR